MKTREKPSAIPYRLKTDGQSSHSRIACWLEQYRRDALPERDCVVLDVGCSEGFLGRLLPPDGFRLIGVDRDAGALAQVPALYARTIQADLEACPRLSLADTPDVIVLADVLEHLRDPAACLRSLLARHARPGTQVIVSLPNVAHLYVRMSLLAGRFEYAERGILDRTHLRHFTWRTGRALVEASGVRVSTVAATPVPLPLIHPIFDTGQPLAVLHAINSALASALKTLWAYQMIFFGVCEWIPGET